ncbi:MAG: sigma 54-interacting transcriptional regulator [Bilophila wadsworthia]
MTVSSRENPGSGRPVARLVHHLSDRTNGPLVEINCAGIPARCWSELFGYEAGRSPEPAMGRRADCTGGQGHAVPRRIIAAAPVKLLQVIREKQIVSSAG